MKHNPRSNEFDSKIVRSLCGFSQAVMVIASAVVLLTAFIAATRCSAQVVTGTLVGVVKDSTGAVVPNASVIAVQTATNVRRTGTTTSGGYFSFPYLAPGPYQVRISAPGFASLVQENVTISVETTARVDAVLTLAGTTGEVTVTAAPPPIQTENAEVNLNLGSHEVNGIPLEYRQAEGLVELSAGVNIDSGARRPPVIRRARSGTTRTGRVFLRTAQ